MKRDTLIYKIIQLLNDNGSLDVNNYLNNIEQCKDVHDIIEKVLDDYVIVEGQIIE
ncbi:hypothetical protein [Cellulosilyticum sp. WCF-2]|uniref:hypothetical protein n=1 Tax=Cellulosilyticum sp. WCF-2 TaxID=2497860 RepID=UPI001680BC61|nr:hypothetical protein [Cellulosilyticum sp. WCF-2]